MNSNEELKNKILFEISCKLDLRFAEQQEINNILEGVFLDYEVNKKITDLVSSDVSEKVIMYLQAMKLKGLEDTTIQNYFYFLRKLSNKITKRVVDINVNDLRMFLFKECEGQKPSTVNMKTTYIQNFFSWMLDEDIIEKNPARKLTHVKVPIRLRSALKIEEIEKLRLACVDSRERVTLELLFATGCRVSEIVEMDIDDLDYTDYSINIIGKGNKERTILFNAKTKVYVENYLKTRKGNSRALITSIKEPYERLGTKGIRYIIKKIATRAGFDKSIYPHLFRNTMATVGLNNGASIVTVQHLLGHSSLTTTQRYAETSMEKVKYEYRQNMVI